jgi:hypothetical protein
MLSSPRTLSDDTQRSTGDDSDLSIEFWHFFLKLVGLNHAVFQDAARSALSLASFDQSVQ